MPRSSSFLLSVLSLSVFALSGCSTMMDGVLQDVTVETPGALGALCDLSTETMRYKVRPPQTIKINKTKGPMTVRCLAPGNREKVITVESKVPESVMLNVTTGILAGIAYDKHSGAIYEYPEKIIVDFQSVPYQHSALPQYHNPDTMPPTDMPLEYMGPANPDLPSDSEKRVQGNLDLLEKNAPVMDEPLK